MMYPNNKQKIIQEFDDQYIFEFIDEIKISKARSRLNSYLAPFVPDELKHESSNAKKYGIKTRQRFCRALKGNLDGYFANTQNHRKKISAKEKAFDTLYSILTLWIDSNPEFSDILVEEYKSIKKTDKEKIDVCDIDFLKFLCKINKEYLISKETIESLYKFGTLVPTPELDNLIQNCKTRLEIIGALRISKKQDIDASKYETELEVKNKQIDTLYKEIEHKKFELNFYQDENSKLQQQIKHFENTDIDKMKDNFKTHLRQKENEVNELKAQLEDYDEIVSQNEKLQVANKTLEGYRKFAIREFYSQMEDKKFRKTLKHLILSDDKTSKLVIKKLNLQEELLLEADIIYNQKLKDENYELEKLTEQKELLILEIAEMQKEKDGYRKKPKVPLMILNEENFKEDFRFKLNKAENDYDFKLHEKLKNDNVIIVEEKKDIEIWLKCQKFSCNPLEVIVEYDWTSYRDWFGFFNNDNKFIHSNTLIADYYKSIKLNSDIPFGMIIFNDFNKILPEIYLESFFQNLEIKGFLDLIHPDTNVQKEYEIFKRIEFLNNIKFVLVKSKSKDAFAIPASLKKYEVF